MIYFVRHGQTYNNVKKLLGGNAELTPEGINQAKATAEKLKDIKFDAIYSSDMIRTVQTAQYINVYHNLPIVQDKRLRERFHGSRELSDETTYNFDEIWTINGEVTYPGIVETISELVSRVKSILEEIKQKHKGKNVLIVSHCGIGRIMQYIHGIVPKSTNLYEQSLNNGEYYTYNN